MAFVLLLTATQCVSPSPAPQPPSPAPGFHYVDYLSPPSVGKPVYDCGTAVAVSGYTIDAKVSIFANGHELLAEGTPYYWWWPFHLNRALKQGDIVTAIQTVGTDSSYPTRELVAAEELPGFVRENQLQAPISVPPLYECQGSVPVTNLLEGGYTEVYSNTLQLIGAGDSPFNNTSLRVKPLVKDKDITAQFSICNKQYVSPFSTPEKVQAPPGALPTPQINGEALIPGAKWVGVSGLTTGTEVTIYAGSQRVGGGNAPGANVAFPITPPVEKDKKYTAEQAFCNLVKSVSAAVDPVFSLQPPTIESPICEGSISVTFLETVPFATLKIFVNGAQKGQGSGTGDRTTLFLGDQVILKASEVITATQEIASVLSAASQPVTVSGQTGAAAVAIEKGFPYVKVGSFKQTAPGPVFVRGVLTSGKFGPVFTATQCGATQVQVKIVFPDDQGSETVTLTPSSSGHFAGGWDWTHAGWQIPADIPVGEYKAIFEITTSSGTTPVEKTFSVFNFYQDCVDRINELRLLENLPPLARNLAMENAADHDAQVNFTQGSHTSESGQAQNECPAGYGSISNIFNVCMKQQMYHDEKACYNQNPSGCYHSACECGHYVNMMDKNQKGYTSVACGLYVSPTGDFLSVQNFHK